MEISGHAMGAAVADGASELSSLSEIFDRRDELRSAGIEITLKPARWDGEPFNFWYGASRLALLAYLVVPNRENNRGLDILPFSFPIDAQRPSSPTPKEHQRPVCYTPLKTPPNMGPHTMNKIPHIHYNPLFPGNC